MSDALRATARQVGLIVAAGAAAALAFGIVLGLAQDESILRWIAYMLYVAGAIVVGFAFFTGAPASPRKLARQRLVHRDEPPPTPADKPFAGELALLVVGGLALFGVGILLELVF